MTFAIRRQRGFTLIELMIAVVVVAILAAIAYPSFLNSIRKGRRADAFASINAIQQAQERWRANKASYAQSVNNAADGTPPGLAMSATSGNGYYTLSLTGASETAYTVVATAVDGKSQVNDTGCQAIAVQASAGNLSYGSGATSDALDWTDAKRCWSR